jgi:hypothetical protein
LSFLLPLSSLLAKEAPISEAPPTPEEVQEAVQKLTKLFTWNQRPQVPQPAAVKQPKWYPLKPEDAKRLDEVLASWDKGRAKSGSLRCQFRQWEYDPMFGPQDPAIPYVYSEGEYRWDGPLIWMWRTTIARQAIASGGKSEWLDVYPENWARNKGTFHELDYRSKTLHECHLPEGSAGIPALSIFGMIVVPFTTPC